MRKSDAIVQLASTMKISPTLLKNYARPLREAGLFADSLPGRAANPVTEDDLINLLIGFCGSKNAINAPSAVAKVSKFKRVSRSIFDPEKRPIPSFFDASTFMRAFRQAIVENENGDLSQWLVYDKGRARSRFLISFDQEAKDVCIIAERWRPAKDSQAEELVARFEARYAASNETSPGDYRASRSIGRLTLFKVRELLTDSAEA